MLFVSCCFGRFLGVVVGLVWVLGCSCGNDRNCF